MTYDKTPPYDPISEWPYCCVPAVLQMILQRRGLPYDSQEDIGYALGLIVPPEVEHRFTRVRIGPEPETGYGTQTSREDFSIARYLRENRIPLRITYHKPENADALRNALIHSLSGDEDVIVCYDSRALFGTGDREHVSLVQSYDTETDAVVMIDPAVGVPMFRQVPLVDLADVITPHELGGRGNLWVLSGGHDRRIQTGTKL